jgi:hypothetical protein
LAAGSPLYERRSRTRVGSDRPIRSYAAVSHRRPVQSLTSRPRDRRLSELPVGRYEIRARRRPPVGIEDGRVSARVANRSAPAGVQLVLPGAIRDDFRPIDLWFASRSAAAAACVGFVRLADRSRRTPRRSRREAASVPTVPAPSVLGADPHRPARPHATSPRNGVATRQGATPRVMRPDPRARPTLNTQGIRLRRRAQGSQIRPPLAARGPRTALLFPWASRGRNSSDGIFARRQPQRAAGVIVMALGQQWSRLTTMIVASLKPVRAIAFGSWATPARRNRCQPRGRTPSGVLIHVDRSRQWRPETHLDVLEDRLLLGPHERANGTALVSRLRPRDGCRAFRNSGGGTRTHNPSVNSRMLCH